MLCKFPELGYCPNNSDKLHEGYEESPQSSTQINRDQSRENNSSSAIDKGKQKAVDVPAPINRGQAGTPNSYLNLLISSCDNLETPKTKTPDSYLRELLMASSAANSPQASPCPHRNLDSGELSLFWRSETLVEDQDDGEDEEKFSAPPPYALNDVSDVELRQVTVSENPPHGPSEPPGSQSRFPIVTVREIDPLESSLESSPNMDTEFRLRGGDRKERYEKLMAKPRPSERSSDVSIGERVKLTVAKMTKNYHMVSSSEEWSEDTSITRYSNQYDFETDQAEVWDSIIMGSRTLQEVCDIRQTLA
jgi:hypothetical protein